MNKMKAKATKDLEDGPEAKRPAVSTQVTAPPLQHSHGSQKGASSKISKAMARIEEKEEFAEGPSGLLSFFGAKAL